MTVWRKVAVVLANVLLAVGFWLPGYDLWFIHRYGFDYTAVAGVFDDVSFGQVIVDWPTGERPLLFIPPLYSYSFPFLLGGLLILLIRPKPPYRGRIRFGTE